MDDKLDTARSHPSKWTSQLALLFVGLWIATVLSILGVASDWSHQPIIFAVSAAGAYISWRVGRALLITISAGVQASQDDATRHRALERYAHTIERSEDEQQIAQAVQETVDLCIGYTRCTMLLPSEDDYSWRRVDGESLPERATPDPRILGWLLEEDQVVARDQLAQLKLGWLLEPVEQVFDAHGAELLIPLINRDEVVGLLTIGQPAYPGPLKNSDLRLLDKIKAITSEAIVYAAMIRKATARARIEKDIDLAAQLQSAFVPGNERIDFGAVTLSGIYAPTSSCGGDWWLARQLPDRRVVVMIGDVTGHGVAAAMVTAAAKGCCDVAIRLMGDDFDVPEILSLLDSAVRRAGGDRFSMTCFASVMAPSSREIVFANAGHVMPYVARTGSESPGLDVLVARGNPLGSGTPQTFETKSKILEYGDFLVWCTDGIVESMNPHRAQFGDRRIQRILRKLDDDDTVVSIRDRIVRAAILFQEGQPPDDDITLVVGRLEDDAATHTDI